MTSLLDRLYEAFVTASMLRNGGPLDGPPPGFGRYLRERRLVIWFEVR